MSKYPVDSLATALEKYDGNELIVKFEGLKVQVFVDTFLHGDEIEGPYGAWIVLVRKVLEDFINSPYREGGIMELSLASPPLSVETLDGQIVWDGT